MKECIITNTDICPHKHISGQTCSPCKIPEDYTICQLTKTKICPLTNKNKISERYCYECEIPDNQTPLFKIQWSAPEGFFGEEKACSEKYAEFISNEFKKVGCSATIEQIKEENK